MSSVFSSANNGFRSIRLYLYGLATQKSDNLLRKLNFLSDIPMSSLLKRTTNFFLSLYIFDILTTPTRSIGLEAHRSSLSSTLSPYCRISPYEGAWLALHL